MADQRVKSVGIIGLGKMGRPIGRHLAKAGFTVAGYDINPETMAAAAGDGIAGAQTPAEVAASSDLTIVLVGFDSEVATALFGQGGVMAGAEAGSIVAVGSTVSPGAMKALAARAEGSGVALLDIPLCRGEPAAESGTLLLMGGGDRAAFDACLPAFATFADAVFHLGPVGAGSVGKMVNNLILWACISANTEGFKLAAELGVEAGPLREALVESSASNWPMQTQIDRLPMPWAEKDMMIVLKEADAARLAMPLAGVVKEVIKGIKIEKGDPMPVVSGE